MNEIEDVTGPVLRPGESGFDDERTGYQLGHPHQPALIVGAEHAGDVQAAVRYAGDRGLPVDVQTTGHGRAAALSGGVLISTRRMAGVEVDPVARTARIEGGVRWEQVIEAAAKHGLAPVSGSSPGVGAVGYTLGGGVGVLARWFGWGSDRVRAVELVTGDGELRHVTADSDPELFRTLRGAGAGLGAVTALEFELVPVTRLFGGALFVDGPHAPALLAAYREWTADLPEELTSSVVMLPYPNLPMVPEHLRGRYVAKVCIAFTGSATDGQRLVAPLRASVPLLDDTLGELPFTEAEKIFNDPVEPHAYTGTNALLRELPPAALEAALDITGPTAPVMCVVGLRHLGGALARPPAVPDSVAHRDAAFALHVLSLVDGTDVPARLHHRLMDALAPWTAGRTPNFRYGASAAQAWPDLHGPDTLRRREALVSRLDPKALFPAAR